MCVHCELVRCGSVLAKKKKKRMLFGNGIVTRGFM